MVAIRVPPGQGGASTLTDLTDVSGSTGPNKSPVGDKTGSLFTLTEVTTQADLDGILSSVAAVNWRPLVLADPRFVAYSTIDPRFAAPAWRLTLNNVVHIQGMVGCAPPLTEDDTGAVLATLDPDSRPLAALLFGCSANPGNNVRLDIDPSGAITFSGLLTGGGVEWFTLSQITFSVGVEQ
jgi:hypothetical protein